MNPRVSFTVLGEKSGAAKANHASSSSPTVALLRAVSPRSASVIISAITRCASRLPPRTVRGRVPLLPGHRISARGTPAVPSRRLAAA